MTNDQLVWSIDLRIARASSILESKIIFWKTKLCPKLRPGVTDSQIQVPSKWVYGNRLINFSKLVSSIQKSKMHLSQSIVALAAIFCCALKSGVFGAITPKPVIVNKCCDLSEHLNEVGECVAGNTNHWWPLIHMVKIQRSFEPLGDAPRFFKIRQRWRPPCDAPDQLIGSNKMALFSNGSLYLSERNQFLHSMNFCIDKEAAILCFPPTPPTKKNNAIDSLIAPKKIAKIRKCCGGKAIYFKSSNTCEIVQQSHEILQRRLLVANASFIDFVYGFPDCKISAHFTIAAAFKQTNLELSTGSLTLDSGRQFEWHEYCLEHTIKDGARPYVSVFTCAEDFAVADVVPDTSNSVNICTDSDARSNSSSSTLFALFLSLPLCRARRRRTFDSFCSRLDC